LIRDLLVAELCDAGYRVMAAADAREAEEACRDYRIDIVFIDVRRPGAAEGWTLAERLRERHPECPMVFAAVAPPSGPLPLSQVLRRPFSMRDALQAIERAGFAPAKPAGMPPAATPDRTRPAGCGSSGHERLAF
jgi:DNA-binding NtrC family response regulator